MKKSPTFVVCKLSNQKMKLSQVVPVAVINPGIARLIRRKYPDLKLMHDDFISKEELKKFRREYIEHVFKTERGEISRLDKEVVQSLVEHELLVKNINAQFEKTRTFGERVSDRMAEFGGSWRFIGIFFFILLCWITVNSILAFGKPFDPFPFILLNLCLSCLAAIQAPIIMMSQNRKEAKDRLRAEHDYKVNLKAELEIRHLHEKIDNLMRHQWQHLLEIQELQLDMMEEKERETYMKGVRRRLWKGLSAKSLRTTKKGYAQKANSINNGIKGNSGNNSNNGKKLNNNGKK
jgi:uncharacterized membrane protein